MKSLVFVGLLAAVHGAAKIMDMEEFLQAKQLRDEALDVDTKIMNMEEFLQAKQLRDEALDVERAVARMELETDGYHYVPYVEPAPFGEGRHLGLGLGLQLGPFGAGASAGVGNGGVGFNSNLGYGYNYLAYGSPDHYKQYWTKPVPQVQYVPVSSRTLGLGAGLQVGPIGAGASAGVGHGQVGLSAGFGWGNYGNYGSPAHYHQYYSKPYNALWETGRNR